MQRSGGGEQPDAVPRSSSQPCVACSVLGYGAVHSSPQCSGTIGRGNGRVWLKSIDWTDVLGLEELWSVLIGVSGLHRFYYKMHKQTQRAGFYPPQDGSLALHARRTLALLLSSRCPASFSAPMALMPCEE